MASKTYPTLALFHALNILFFATFTSACGSCISPEPKTPPAKMPTPRKCPKDTLKLGVCADVLGLVNIVLGSPAVTPCCGLLQGLADLEAAVCLCTALKANILGINLDIPISLSLLLNVCSKDAPSDFVCA